MGTAVRRPAAPMERPTELWLNGRQLLTLQTTPAALDEWALGFLFTEGIISGAAKVSRLQVAGPERGGPGLFAVAVEATLAPSWDPELVRRRYLTSGCGKGVTFSSLRDAMALQPLTHALAVDHDRLVRFQRSLRDGAVRYRRHGGIHAAALAHTEFDAVLVREDIGRHNAVDKAVGAALRRGWDLRRCVLVTSGRISYDMCAKLCRSRIAVGASRTAATDQAVRLADRQGVTLVGYLRPEGMVVYVDAAGRILVPQGHR